ncbi:DUF4097 family beta strand repeat-containing protein [Colwellia sp. MEBiC06753]
MENFQFTIKTLALTILLAASAVQADETKVIEQAFNVGEGASFSLENINGPVTIGRSNNASIEVIARITADNETELSRINVVMVQHANSVHVETKYEESNRHRNNSGKVDYQVALPAHIAETEIDLVNGSLTISELAGKFDLDLVNGSVEANKLNGNGKIHSVNGSITANYTELDSVSKINLETVNGGIKLFLPSNASFTVDAETMHGSMKSDFSLPVDKNFFSGSHMKGTVGSGDIKVNLESVNGSIAVSSR